MCGICGIVDFANRPPAGKVEAMNSAMESRGPDAQGVVSYDYCVLGHRRLSIIDLDPSANQPMIHQPTQAAIVFNGEIYNYLELRAQLESKGHKFRTNSDTEVILAAYGEYGHETPRMLNGMFSFAIWDPNKSSLFLCRDRVGKKPFYYAVGRGWFAFASELRGLLKGLEAKPSIEPQSIFEYFLYDFIPAPHTAFQGIYKLEPATAAVFDGQGLQQWKYWSPPLPEPDSDYLVTRDSVHELLRDSVTKRLISDVPLGAFLSGGVDSSLIVALMKRMNSAQVKTFSISFPGSTHDESRWSRLASGRLASEHSEFPCEYDIQYALEKMIPHFGEPFGDCSAIPTLLLCKHTSERVTVALSGDGGDELFGGYDRYLARKLQGVYDYLPGWAREKFIEPMIERIPETTNYYGTSFTKKLRLFTRAAKRLRADPLAVVPRSFTIEQAGELLGNQYIPQADPAIETARQWAGLDPVSQMMFTDMQTYMAEDILTKVDRMSMAHSLEVRSPLLDYRVVEAACRAPLDFKIRGSLMKRILKDVAGEYVPREILARSKYGFQVPMGQWFKGDLREWAEAKLFDSTQADLSNRALERLWDEHQRGATDNGLRIWSALVYIQWREWLKTL